MGWLTLRRIRGGGGVWEGWVNSDGCYRLRWGGSLHAGLGWGRGGIWEDWMNSDGCYGLGWGDSLGLGVGMGFGRIE